MVERMLQTNGVTLPHLFEAPVRDAVIAAAAAGLGAGLLFQSEVAPDGRLKIGELELAQPKASVLAVVADGGRDIPAIARFLDVAGAGA